MRQKERATRSEGREIPSEKVCLTMFPRVCRCHWEHETLQDLPGGYTHNVKSVMFHTKEHEGIMGCSQWYRSIAWVIEHDHVG